MPQRLAARDEARFVFQGTVQAANAASLAAISGTKDTSVVRVDRIVRGSDLVIDFAGRRITVRAADGRKFKVGEQGTFYTNVWLLGESLAVDMLDFEPAQATTAALAAAVVAAPTGNAVENFKRHELKGRVESADIVVSGRVTAVRLVGDEPAAPAAAAATAAAASAAPKTTRISEHSPVWQEATVEIGQVHKGSHNAQTAVVRFPASTDVRWYRAPKLTPGQEGVFVLHSGDRAQAAEPAAVRAALAAAPQPSGKYYTALDPADFQPLDRAPQISNMVDVAAAAPATAARGRTTRAKALSKSRAKAGAAKRAAFQGSSKASAGAATGQMRDTAKGAAKRKATAKSRAAKTTGRSRARRKSR